MEAVFQPLRRKERFKTALQRQSNWNAAWETFPYILINKLSREAWRRLMNRRNENGYLNRIIDFIDTVFGIGILLSSFGRCVEAGV